jgi:DNA-binding NarL/FixJ family response regulator
VLIADDHAGMVRALGLVLAPSCEIVGSVADSVAVLEAVSEHRPDVVVLDVTMPSIGGLEVCRRITEAPSHAKVVMLSAIDDAAIREKAFELGASAYVVKSRLAQELIPAIRKALLASV